MSIFYYNCIGSNNDGIYVPLGYIGSFLVSQAADVFRAAIWFDDLFNIRRVNRAGNAHHFKECFRRGLAEARIISFI